jgi:hypothetical protein
MSFDAIRQAVQTGGGAVLGPRGAGGITRMGQGGTAMVLAEAGLKAGGGAMERAVARRNARILRQRAEVEAAQARREGAAIISHTRVEKGKSGGVVGSGSSADVVLAQAEAVEMRALRTAYPFLAEAAAMETEGDLALYGGLMEGASSILGAGVRSRLSRAGPSGVPPAPLPPRPRKRKKRPPLGSPSGGPLPPPQTRTT